MTKKYKHITLSERILIETQLQKGLTSSAIAESLRRRRSSIARELARNDWKPTPEKRPVRRPPLVGGYVVIKYDVLIDANELTPYHRR